MQVQQACRPASHLRLRPRGRVQLAAMASSTNAQGSTSSGVDQSIPLYRKLSMPVYSLSTKGAQGRRDTMNLVTYCAPVSISPRRMALGLYKGTVSAENFLHAKEGVMQVLQEVHTTLFTLLGKTSAQNVDKMAALAEQYPAPLITRYGHTVLSDAACLMRLRAVSEPMPCGDHDVVICEVVEYENMTAQPQPLYSDFLREKGLL